MPTDVVSLLISFMAVAVAGAAAYFSWKVPMALREEKFKEIIYARRLAIYDDLLAQIPRILFRHASFCRMQKEEDSLLECLELTQSLAQFKMAYEGASHMLPEKFQMLCINFQQSFPSDQTQIAQMDIKLPLAYWFLIIDFVRADQAVEVLSGGIKESIGPPR